MVVHGVAHERTFSMHLSVNICYFHSGIMQEYETPLVHTSLYSACLLYFQHTVCSVQKAAITLGASVLKF